MKWFYLPVIVFLIVQELNFIACGFPDPTIRTQGEVWPLPQKIEYGRENRTIRKGSITILFQGLNGVDCDVLEFAKRTYQREWMFPKRTLANLNAPSGIRLVVRTEAKCPEKDEYPQQNMNEEYFLQIPPSGDAILEAEEVWGILRGLETFSQLIFQQNGQYYLKTATIHDWPEYAVRGVLIDSSRHFLPKKTILRQLDIMAQNKMNLMHWHIVDSESFPYVSRKFPHLSERGAYTPTHVYTKADVQEIIDHAKMRGIRVMAEFDTPGHMGSWKLNLISPEFTSLKGELGLLAECRDLQGKLIPSNIIDPTLDRNYLFLKNFFDEILSVFPERFIHLGGDEVTAYIECWRSNPKIIEFMQRKDLNTTGLEDYYYGKLQDIIADLLGMDKNARMVFWQEVFQFNNPRPNAIAHLWQYADSELPKEIERLTSLGYLNYIAYGKDYDKYYNRFPRDFNGTDEQKKLVLGGIAAVWAEFISAANIETVLWPRASSVAERLWSSPKLTPDAQEAWPRLYEHTCRLINRGYRAIPLDGPSYCQNEYEEND